MLERSDSSLKRWSPEQVEKAAEALYDFVFCRIPRDVFIPWSEQCDQTRDGFRDEARVVLASLGVSSKGDWI